MFYRDVKRIAADGTVLPWGDVLSFPLKQQLGGGVSDILLKGDKIYFAGTRNGSTPNSEEIKVVALNDDGSFDMSYGTAGVTQTGSVAPPERAGSFHRWSASGRGCGVKRGRADAAGADRNNALIREPKCPSKADRYASMGRCTKR